MKKTSIQIKRKIPMLDDEFYMKKALELAKKAYDLGEIPVGCVIVQKSTGKIIGEGYNRRETDNCPVSHAEILAIKEAGKNTGSWRINDSCIYITLEPCPMCSGAIINARIDRVVYGANDEKSGCCTSVMNMFEFPFNHKPIIKSGILEIECQKILTDFFNDLRNKKRDKI